MGVLMKAGAVFVFLVIPCWLVVLIAGHAPWDVWAVLSAFMAVLVVCGVVMWRSA